MGAVCLLEEQMQKYEIFDEKNKQNAPESENGQNKSKVVYNTIHWVINKSFSSLMTDFVRREERESHLNP